MSWGFRVLGSRTVLGSGIWGFRVGGLDSRELIGLRFLSLRGDFLGAGGCCRIWDFVFGFRGWGLGGCGF